MLTEFQDDTRYWTIAGEDKAWKSDIGPMSNYFSAVNRNKKSVALNLKHARGREIFLEIMKEADVVYVSRPPRMDHGCASNDMIASRTSVRATWIDWVSATTS